LIILLTSLAKSDSVSLITFFIIIFFQYKYANFQKRVGIKSVAEQQ